MDNYSELGDSVMRQNSKSHPEVRQKKNKNEFYTIQNSQPPPPNL